MCECVHACVLSFGCACVLSFVYACVLSFVCAVPLHSTVCNVSQYDHACPLPGSLSGRQ